MVDLVGPVQVDRMVPVQVGPALGRVDLAGPALGRVDLAGSALVQVGRPTLPADPVPQLAHLVGSRVTANRVKLAQTPVNPPVNPQLLAPKLNSPG